MIRVAPTAHPAIEILVDQSRVLVVDDPTADVVTLGVGDTPVSDGHVMVSSSELARVLEVAGAGAESRAAVHDRYGRVPSSANPLVAEGVERRPVVTEMAVALRERVRQAAGRRCVHLVAPWPDGKRWAAAFTHDVDVVVNWALFTGLRLVELLRKGELRCAARQRGRPGRRVTSRMSPSRVPSAACWMRWRRRGMRSVCTAASRRTTT